MAWFTNMIWLWIFGLTPVVLSLVFGVYWLRNERFPWESSHHLNREPINKEHIGRQ